MVLHVLLALHVQNGITVVVAIAGESVSIISTTSSCKPTTTDSFTPISSRSAVSARLQKVLLQRDIHYILAPASSSSINEYKIRPSCRCRNLPSFTRGDLTLRAQINKRESVILRSAYIYRAFAVSGPDN